MEMKSDEVFPEGSAEREKQKTQQKDKQMSDEFSKLRVILYGGTEDTRRQCHELLLE